MKRGEWVVGKNSTRLTKAIEETIQYNLSVDYSHVTDLYFKDKLDKGLILYKPQEWVELTSMDENKLEGHSH